MQHQMTSNVSGSLGQLYVLNLQEIAAKRAFMLYLGPLGLDLIISDFHISQNT